MRNTSLLAGATIALSMVVTAAAADTIIVTGGEARITLTADFGALALGTSWSDNDDGQPEYFNHVRSSPGYEYTYLSRSGELRTWTASENSGSTYISDTEAKLKLASSTLYLFPTDADGNAIETFAPSVWIAPQRSSNDGYDLFTDELRDINFVPVGDPATTLTWEDFKNPGTTYTLSEAQRAFLTEEVDDLRLCCSHTLGSLEIDVAANTIDGVIDSIAERDINFDGVIDENDEFYLFDLVDNGEGGYDMALTATMAQYLNFGFTALAFADPTDFVANWANPDGYLSFAEGDVIGSIAYSYTTAPAPVPVPAALSLLAGGMGVFGLVGVRRKRNA